MPDEDTVIEAVEMVIHSLSGAIIQRETAVRVMLPQVRDSNSCILTATTLYLGMLVWHMSGHDPQSYERGIRQTITILKRDRERIQELTETIFKQWQKAGRP